ncbi:MAG: V-type ATP synthase subunit E [Anaerovoracaceae bacterium]
MSIEKITSKIVADAEASAKEFLEIEKQKSDGILKEAKDAAHSKIKLAEESGLSEKEKLITRKKSVADIDGKKMILQGKQELINACFDEAIDRITSMEQSKYVDFLAQMVKKTGETSGQLLMNDKERKNIGQDLVIKVKELIPGCNIELADEVRPIRGGFLLKNDLKYINGTVEALVDEGREALVLEVAKKLFGEE